MRRLLRMLHTPERILVWLEACEGMLDKTNFDRNIVTEAMETLNEIVAIADEYHDGAGNDFASNPLIDRLFEVWMEDFQPAHFEGFLPAEHTQKMICDALGQFGKKRPKARIFYCSIFLFFFFLFPVEKLLDNDTTLFSLYLLLFYLG